MSSTVDIFIQSPKDKKMDTHASSILFLFALKLGKQTRGMVKRRPRFVKSASAFRFLLVSYSILGTNVMKGDFLQITYSSLF